MRSLWFAGAIAALSLLSTGASGTPVPTPEQTTSNADHEQPPLPPIDATKYFHEPGGNMNLGHYDARFFVNEVSYDDRSDTLQHMIRAYLNTFREKGIETWIAHGTLLGWWWNGKIMPWDWDLDTQVSGATLEYLGKHFNQTIHHYVSEDKKVERDYLLDVNPHSAERMRGDGMNIIDARWIDMRNGLYIDITGLSETHPDIAPGIWSCKNYHRYNTSDLYPMRESTFEGVPALVPYSYDQILVQEYRHSALITTEWYGHRWDVRQKEWVPIPEGQAPLAMRPHVPRTLQPMAIEPGLRNIWRSLNWS